MPEANSHVVPCRGPANSRNSQQDDEPASAFIFVSEETGRKVVTCPFLQTRGGIRCCLKTNPPRSSALGEWHKLTHQNQLACSHVDVKAESSYFARTLRDAGFQYYLGNNGALDTTTVASLLESLKDMDSQSQVKYIVDTFSVGGEEALGLLEILENLDLLAETKKSI